MKATLIRFTTLAALAAASLIGASASAFEGINGFTISGRVTRNGVTVQAASVQLQSTTATSPRARVRTSTGTDGTFQFGDIEPGSYVVRAFKEGFGTGRSSVSVGSTTLGSPRRVTVRLR